MCLCGGRVRHVGRTRTCGMLGAALQQGGVVNDGRDEGYHQTDRRARGGDGKVADPVARPKRRVSKG